MKREQIIVDIKRNLTRLEQIISLIETFKNTDSSVEMDLFQKNITILFENYVRLKLANENPVQEKGKQPLEQVVSEKPATIELKPVVLEKPVSKEFITTPELSVNKNFGFSFNIEKEAADIGSPKAEKIEELIQSTITPNTVEISERAQPIKQVVKPLPIEVKSEGLEPEKDLTINDMFSSLKSEPNLATKHLSNPIADLSKEISLNKKFAFVNELFGGEMEHYSKAISQLNNIGSLSSAHLALSELMNTFNWNKESYTVNEFIDLVERRWEK